MVQSLVFVPGGPTEMCVNVTAFEDEIGEDDEFFTCILTGPVPPPVTVRVTIIDDGKTSRSFILDRW